MSHRRHSRLPRGRATAAVPFGPAVSRWTVSKRRAVLPEHSGPSISAGRSWRAATAAVDSTERFYADLALALAWSRSTDPRQRQEASALQLQGLALARRLED